MAKECDCGVFIADENSLQGLGDTVKHCPLHKAAPTLLEALKAAYQVLSGHHDALGHDSETDPAAKRCVGCDVITQAAAAIEEAEKA